MFSLRRAGSKFLCAAKTARSPVAASKIATTAAFRGKAFSTKAATSTGIDCISATIGLDEDQASFYELARGFADNEMKPYAQVSDSYELLL
jgi:hypothetical protein